MFRLVLGTAILVASTASFAPLATASNAVQGPEPRPLASVPILRVADKTFHLLNILPFPVDVKIHGSGPTFPMVVRVPAAPAPPVPIPYPDSSMQISLKKPNGTWTSKFKINWKSGPITLPGF